MAILVIGDSNESGLIAVLGTAERSEMEDVIYTICPIDTQFIDEFSIAQKTIIRFSGEDEKVIKWFRNFNRRKMPRIKHEWITDELVPNVQKTIDTN